MFYETAESCLPNMENAYAGKLFFCDFIDTKKFDANRWGIEL